MEFVKYILMDFLRDKSFKYIWMQTSQQIKIENS